MRTFVERWALSVDDCDLGMQGLEKRLLYKNFILQKLR